MKSFTLVVERRHAEAAIATAIMKGVKGNICTDCAVAQAAREKFPNSKPSMGFTELYFNTPKTKYKCEENKITWIDTREMIEKGMATFKAHEITFPVILHFNQMTP